MHPETPRDRGGKLLAMAREWSSALQGWAAAPERTVGPHLDADQIQSHNQRNRQQTLALGGSMALLLLCAAALLAGWPGLLLALLSLTGMVLLGPRAAPDANETSPP